MCHQFEQIWASMNRKNKSNIRKLYTAGIGIQFSKIWSIFYWNNCIGKIATQTLTFCFRFVLKLEFYHVFISTSIQDLVMARNNITSKVYKYILKIFGGNMYRKGNMLRIVIYKKLYISYTCVYTALHTELCFVIYVLWDTIKSYRKLDLL